MGAVMMHLRETLPPETVMTNGAGNYATWLHRFYRFTRYGTQAAPTSGSMGYGEARQRMQVAPRGMTRYTVH